MAVGTPVVLAKGGSLDDLTTYSFTPTTPTAGRLVLLHVFSWHPSITAEVPSSVTGLGLGSWQAVMSVLSSNSRGRWAVLRGNMAGTPAAGALTINFTNAMGGVAWQLVEYPGVDATTPIVQAAAASMSTTAPEVNLPAAVAAGNSTTGFAGSTSGTGEDFGAGAGYALVGTEFEQSGFSAHAIFAQVGRQLVAFTRTGTSTSPKGIIGLELKAASTGSTSTPPEANAGVDQTAVAAQIVTLSGSATDAEGGTITYAWTQTAGPAVTLAGTGATRTFVAPYVATETPLVFRLTATDSTGLNDVDSVTVTVAAHDRWGPWGNPPALVPYVDGDIADVSPVAPAAPTGLAVGTVTTTSIALSWSAAVVPSGGDPVTEYRVYVNGATAASATVQSTSTTISGLIPGTAYSFRVRAYNGLLSPLSGTVTGSTTGTNPNPDPTGWRLAYDTDFPATERANWLIRNNQTQSNDESTNQAANVEFGALGNGRGLRIWGRRENVNGRSFTSGEIEGTGRSRLIVPNYFRCRVEGYHDEDSGFWPALLWYRPESGGDGSNGELDVMEYFGGLFSGTNRRVALTMHNEYGATQDSIKNPILYTELHKSPGLVTVSRSYTLEKTPGLIKCIIDDDSRDVRYFGPNAPGGGPTKSWWNRIMESPTRTWYPRITLQLGGNAGPIAANWQEGSMQVTRFQQWVQA